MRIIDHISPFMVIAFRLTTGLSSAPLLTESSLSIGDKVVSIFSIESDDDALPQPLTRMCLYFKVSTDSLFYGRAQFTLSASFLEKLFSQCVQGKGLTAR